MGEPGMRNKGYVNSCRAEKLLVDCNASRRHVYVKGRVREEAEVGICMVREGTV
jgi:hypothetical protein